MNTVNNLMCLWGLLLLLPYWLYIFYNYKDIRNQMIKYGLFFSLFSLFIGHFYNNLWPSNSIILWFFINIIIYGFIFGGLATALAHSLYNYNNKCNLLIILYLNLIAACYLIITNILLMNNIMSLIIPLLIIGIINILNNRNNIGKSFVIGFVTMILVIIYQEIVIMLYPNALNDISYFNDLSGLFIANLSLEKIFFGYALGFGSTCFYDSLKKFVTSHKQIKKHEKTTIS